MDHIFIHADMVNGNALVAKGDVTGIEVDECQDMDDVRHYLSHMSADGAQPFERLLKVPADLMDTIDQEYGLDL